MPNKRHSYIVLGKLRYYHIIFLCFHPFSTLTLVAESSISTSKLILFILRSLFVQVNVLVYSFERVTENNVSFFQYSIAALTKTSLSYFNQLECNLPSHYRNFYRSYFLRYLQSTYHIDIELVRQILGYKYMLNNNIIPPSSSLILSVRDQLFFNIFINKGSSSEYFNDCKRLNLRPIFLPCNYCKFARYLLLLGVFIVWNLIKYNYRYFASSTSRSSPASSFSDSQLVVFCADEPLTSSSINRSIKNFSIIRNYEPDKCYGYRSNVLHPIYKGFPVISNTSLSLMAILKSSLSLYYALPFVTFLHALLSARLPRLLAYNISFLYFIDFLCLIRRSNLVSKVGTHLFTDNNYFTDALVLYNNLFRSLSPNGRSIIHICQLQYSCQSFPSPPMLSSAESLLLFDDSFKSSFCIQGFGPSKCLKTNYIFNIDTCNNIDKLKEADASQLCRGYNFNPSDFDFVIGFLDESIQYNTIFPAISYATAYSEFNLICCFALQLGNVAIISKPQFVKNAPSAVFPSMKSLQQLISKRSYFEICDFSGNSHHNRNVLLPSSAFAGVDICIGSAMGGTAVYECALSGKRAVIYNCDRVASPILSLNYRGNVLYPSLYDILDDLKSMSSRALFYESDIGRWV